MSTLSAAGLSKNALSGGGPFYLYAVTTNIRGKKSP
jgi:hypothetical protein